MTCLASERSRWATVQKMKPGDYLLCYLTRVSRWVGLLEVVGEPFFDEEPIWSSEAYPSRSMYAWKSLWPRSKAFPS